MQNNNICKLINLDKHRLKEIITKLWDNLAKHQRQLLEDQISEN